MLSGLLRECPDRVAADLRRFFGVRLSDMYEGREDVLEVAHYAAHLPSGGAVGEWFGGELALSAEVAAIRALEFTTAQSQSPKKLKKPPLPDGVRDLERKRAKALAKAEKFRAKTR